MDLKIISLVLVITAFQLNTTTCYPITRTAPLWAKPCGNWSSLLSKTELYSRRARDLLAEVEQHLLEHPHRLHDKQYKIKLAHWHVPMQPRPIHKSHVERVMRSLTGVQLLQYAYCNLSRLCVFLEEVSIAERMTERELSKANIMDQAQQDIRHSLCKLRQLLVDHKSSIPRPAKRSLYDQEIRDFTTGGASHDPDTTKMSRYMRDYIVTRDGQQMLDFHVELFNLMENTDYLNQTIAQ